MEKKIFKKYKGVFYWKKENKNRGEILYEKENLKLNEINFLLKSFICI